MRCMHNWGNDKYMIHTIHYILQSTSLISFGGEENFTSIVTHCTYYEQLVEVS